MQDSGPRILIVDNDPESAARARVYLEGEGFHVEVSEGASGAALWLAQTFRPWVVIARHNLPATDGVEVCRLLKGDSETAHVSLILSSPRPADEQLTVAALEAGASVVLGGPLNQQVLVAHVYSQLNVFQLVMELREKNHFIRNLVQRDPMTGLYNAAYLHELLDRDLQRAGRSNSPVSLLLVDLDNFRTINDAHGHQAGDYVLKTVSELLQVGARRTDLVGRSGGDIFAIVLPDMTATGAATRAETLRASLESRAFADRRLPSVTMSVGVATFPQDGTDRSSLYAAAEHALFVAKKVGRNRVIGYRPDLGSEGTSANMSGPELERLLAIGDVIHGKMASFVYQPIIYADTGQIYAHEALCRTKHAAFPHAGALFNTAEKAGRVVELGRALRTVSTVPLRDLPAPLLLFLNLHPFELSEELVHEATTTYAQWAGRIVFEVTECSEIHDYEKRRSIIARLQEAGYQVAVDDLGAGYAGLNAVAMLRPNIVKLDMTLIRGIQHDTSASRLIRHILDFADGEGIQVVAEGVETEEERRVVTELGCPLLQGYYFAKPGLPFPTVQNVEKWRPVEASSRRRA